MGFANYYFLLLFLPITVICYFSLNKAGQFTLANAFLIVASLLFYGYSNTKALLIFVIYILLNYYLYTKTNNNKTLLIISILLNILFLLFYKYINIFNNLFSLSNSTILMPLGVSFYSFSQISFVIESYKTDVKYTFIEYALFMTFFPKIIQGPIEDGTSFIKQIRDKENRKIDYSNLYVGLYLVMYGLFKKVILADAFNNAVSWGYNNLSKLDTINSLIVIISYTLQIYLDFSGYTNIAVGISKMFNIDLIDNFDAPYASNNIGEFWKKWHISLTKFFTKFIYIPLGGNKKGWLITCLNTLIVFALSGIWHGADINYLIWGIMNGMVLIGYKTIKDKNINNNTFISWLLTFIFINLSWIVFRANSLNDVALLIGKLFTFDGINIVDGIRESFDFTEFDFIPECLYFVRVLKTSRFYVLTYIAVGFFISIKDSQIKRKIENNKLLGFYKFILILIFVYSLLSFTNNGVFIYEGF